MSFQQPSQDKLVIASSEQRHTPLEMANAFIQRAGDKGVEHMKLQKLVYYAYGWWLAYSNTPLLTEPPEAWKHGPVFSSLYEVLKGKGGKPIREPQRSVFFQPAPLPNVHDKNVLQLRDWIWDRYGDFDSFALSNMSHERDSPWYQVVQSHNFRIPFHTKIPDEITSACFRRMAEEAKI